MPGRAAATIVPDSLPGQLPVLQLRNPNPQKLQAFREKKEFQYGVDYKPSASLWDQFWFRVNKFFRGLFANPTTATYLNYIIYALALGITIFVILKLLQVNFVSLFGRQSTAMPIPYETYGEDIHVINFPELIAEAEAQGDFRRAVRLYYLSILKNLTDNSLIEWQPGKTNRSYVTELKSGPLRQSFAQVTQLFEQVWYGSINLEQPGFARIATVFREFKTQITARV